MQSHISWSSISSAFLSLPHLKRIEVVKWNSDFCATGKNLQRRREQSHSACPSCGASGETTSHILQCPHPSVRSKWNATVAGLEQWMKSQQTAPDISNIVVANLHGWCSHQPPITYAGPLPYLSEACSRQASIGWESFLRGFPASSWIYAQQDHYNRISSKRTGKRWLSELIKKLWSVSWDMWRFRNGILHSKSPDAPTNLTFLLTAAIITELNHGGRLLPPSCTYLFSTTMSALLNTSINNKKLWLATVWSARDHFSPADNICQSRNIIVAASVEPWKKRVQLHAQ